MNSTVKLYPPEIDIYIKSVLLDIAMILEVEDVFYLLEELLEKRIVLHTYMTIDKRVIATFHFLRMGDKVIVQLVREATYISADSYAHEIHRTEEGFYECCLN